MAAFAYRILPPRVEFWASLEPGEVALLARHLQHLRKLKEEGTVQFVGRAEEINGQESYTLRDIARIEIASGRVANVSSAPSKRLTRLALRGGALVTIGALDSPTGPWS